MRWAVGMAGKVGSRHTARRTSTAGKRSRRSLPPAQALKQTASRWPALQQKQQLPQMMSACRAVRRGGVQSCWQPERRVQTYLLPLPQLSPLPVTVPTHSLNFEKTQFSPNLFFCFYFYFLYFPTINRPLTPFTVCVRLTYPVPSLLPTLAFPSRRGIREG